MPSYERTLFERHPIATLLIVSGILFVFLDVAAANAYRLIFRHTFHGRHSAAIHLRAGTYREDSDIFHHGLQKNLDDRLVAWGHIPYRMSTDSLGLRSRSSTQTPLKSPGHRILFTGDSFTEGTGIDYAETFVGRIEQALKNQDIDVLNAGVISYSPVIHLHKIKYLVEEVGLEIDELVVFIDISDPLDELNRSKEIIDRRRTNNAGNQQADDVPQTAPKNSKGDFVEEIPGPPIQQFLYKNSIFIYWIANQVHDYFNVARDGFNVNMPQSLWTIDKNLFEQYGRPGLLLAEKYMDTLNQLAVSHDIPLTIAVYPWPDQISNKDIDSIQVRFWTEWADRNRVKVIDYFPCFIKPRCDQNCDNATLREYFIEGDVHWNSRGHELIASRFLALYPKLHSSPGTRVNACDDQHTEL